MGSTGCAKRAVTGIDSSLPELTTDLGELAPKSVLTTAAASADPTPRARSLQYLIAANEHVEDGDWAEKALHDSDPWVQRAGVLAISTRLHERAAIALLEGYVATAEADPYVRGAAGLHLATTDSSTAASTLSAAWRKETELWRQAPLALAAAVLGDKDALEPLERALRRGELALEVGFLVDLGNSGQSGLLPALREGAEWAEPEMQLPYAVALVALGDLSGEQALRKALASNDEEDRLEALDYLSAFDHPTAQALLKRAKSTGTHQVRTYAALALASQLAEPSDVFSNAINDEDPEIRALAVRFVADATQNPSANRKVARAGKALVVDALADPDPSVRTEAMRALVLLDMHGEEEALNRNLQDQYEALRIEAAGALLSLARTQ